MIRRMSQKNPINAKNFTAKAFDQRRTELQKARQNFQQNSFLVDSPSIIYYQQVRNGFTCTCHAIDLVLPTENLDTKIVEPTLTNYSDKVTEVSFSTISKTPMFGTLPVEDNPSEDDSKLLDDTETEKPLFGSLFHKGTDCGICFRTGFTPLFSPVGRQFYALTSHNYEDLNYYHVNTVKAPNVFESSVSDGYVEFKFKVPKYFKTMRYAVYNNTEHLIGTDLYISKDEILTPEWLNIARGSDIHIQVHEVDFTHVFIEFDLGIETRANFPQFSVSKDYSYFFNLQQITIELPPSINNAQVNDLIYCPTWDRMFQAFDIQPKYEGPLQNVLLGTTIQARLVQPVETPRVLTHLKELLKGR